MGVGKQLYEEKKRLKLEANERMEQVYDARMKREAEMDVLADLAMKAVRSFLEGKACFVIGEGHEPGSKIVSFQMPTT